MAMTGNTELRQLTRHFFRIGLAAIVLLAVILLVFAINSRFKLRNDARYATEAQLAVEEFLKASDPTVLGQLQAPNDLGTFLRFEGSGFSYPFWNIQGYHYLTLNRTGYFSRGTLPIRIIVSEGRRTAPDLNAIGKPRVERGMIFVSHPNLFP